jgi:hypothetical protein
MVYRISTRAARAARPVPRASHNGADGPTRTCRCPSATHPRTQSALPVWQFQPQPRAPAVSSSQPSPRPPAAIGIVSGPVAVQCTVLVALVCPSPVQLCPSALIPTAMLQVACLSQSPTQPSSVSPAQPGPAELSARRQMGTNTADNLSCKAARVVASNLA